MSAPYGEPSLSMTSPKTSTLPQAKIALALSGESADRGTVESQIVVALHQEFLVVVEHVQPALEIAEKDRDGFNAFFVRQVLETFFLDFLNGSVFLAMFFCFQIQFFELLVGEG